MTTLNWGATSTAIILIIILVVAIERRDRRTQGVDSHTGKWVELPKPPRFTKQESLSYVACYILYFCLVAVSIASYFLWPPAILALIAALSAESDFQRPLYVAGNFLIVFILFGLLIAAEPYLRAGSRMCWRLSAALRCWRCWSANSGYG